MIEDLSEINVKKLEQLLKKRKIYLDKFEDSLYENLCNLFNNDYLNKLKQKIIENYTKGATNEIFDDDDYALFYIRLYRMIKAIKQIENDSD